MKVSEWQVLGIIALYFIMLIVVSRITSRRANNDSFFTGNHSSPWFIVAYGMIGASLSGVTFMSVPGYVQHSQFTYMGVIFGYVIGYVVIALVLLPLYYKLKLTSIYTFLYQQFGTNSHKTGSFFFIISRLLGSALRMYLVVYVLYEFAFKNWGIPFELIAIAFIVLILGYTFKGGIKTIIWTDTLQTTFMLLATVATIWYILADMGISFGELFENAAKSGYSTMIDSNWRSENFFLKQLLSGAFITIAMTGLDQDMMQKNLTCRSLRDAQKNMFSLSISLVFVNFLFLSLGATLLYYAQQTGFELPAKSDGIFPLIAFSLSSFTAIAFLVGLIAAGYSSADGTLTALTTTFCYDFLRFDTTKKSEKEKTRLRKQIHICFALLYLLVIIAFKPFHTDSLIKTIFDIAGYTYGPLLGLFSFGLIMKQYKPNDHYIPYIAVASPIICYIININSVAWFNGYVFGFEMLILNGLLTFLGIWAISKRTINNGITEIA
ncbi:MAG: sodium:solute symporter [Bacteroidales bacterium]|jgi:Na+/proline symporter|nr:sodium:solute symporter [Bacteroidales bacterium]